MMYIPDESDDTIYVFASKGGAPSNPDWYYNLTAAGEGSIERGTLVAVLDCPRRGDTGGRPVASEEPTVVA